MPSPTLNKAILPVNPTGITSQTSVQNSNFKTMSQLCNTVNTLSAPSTISGDLGPSGANTRTLRTDYTAAFNLFVAVTLENMGGAGTGLSIIPWINDSKVGPVTSVTNSSGPCGTGFIVPSGSTYKITAAYVGTGGPYTLGSWFETTLP